MKNAHGLFWAKVGDSSETCFVLPLPLFDLLSDFFFDSPVAVKKL